eukprot:scaffold100330_cov35-Tisochrysis_lutea.AAC.1
MARRSRLGRCCMLHADAGEGAGGDVPAGPAQTIDPSRARKRACEVSERLSISACICAINHQSWPRL